MNFIRFVELLIFLSRKENQADKELKNEEYGHFIAAGILSVCEGLSSYLRANFDPKSEDYHNFSSKKEKFKKIFWLSALEELEKSSLPIETKKTLREEYVLKLNTEAKSIFASSNFLNNDVRLGHL